MSSVRVTKAYTGLPSHVLSFVLLQLPQLETRKPDFRQQHVNWRYRSLETIGG